MKYLNLVVRVSTLASALTMGYLSSNMDEAFAQAIATPAADRFEEQSTDFSDSVLEQATPTPVSETATISDYDHVSFSAIDLIEQSASQIESSTALWIDESPIELLTDRLTAGTPPTVLPQTSSTNPDDGPMAQVPNTNTSQSDDNDWQITLWGGPLTDADIGQAILFDVELEDSYLIGLAGNRPIKHLNDRLQLEAEIQAFKHFGDQDHLEFTAGVGIRWQVSKPISVAFFDGLSLATETPELEEARAEKANPLLNYFALEVEVEVAEDWAVAARIHHRSGVFGLFNGVKRGSNAYLFGVRHTL